MIARFLVFASAALLIPFAAVAEADFTDSLRSIERDPVRLRQAVDAGRQTAAFCANCHGENGNSTIPEVPNLAGQNPAYILEQMRKFERGERRDPFMQGLIKVLTADDRLSVALFYSVSQPPPRVIKVADVVRGREFFRSRCAGCHGEAAHGSDRFPRLAGQHPTYLKLSLARYRDRSGERNSTEMNSIAAALGDTEIAALATYLAALP